MRIGHVAALLGVSTRTIRHYHHAGVAPEPERDPNGYRRYTIDDAVRLARARRLAGLGMSLQEVADALSDDATADLEKILTEIDLDLARQEREIAEARERIGRLLTQARADIDEVTAPTPTRLAERLAAAGADGPLAHLDAQFLSLLPEEEASRWLPALVPEDPALLRQLVDVYTRLDVVADAEPDDPRVAALAEEVLNLVPAELREQLAIVPDAADVRLVIEAIGSELTPSQVAVMRIVMERLARR